MRPSEADLAVLHRGEAGAASVIAIASGEAVGALLSSEVPPLAHAFERSAGKGRFEVGVRGTVTATTPVLDVVDGVATAHATVSFGDLQGGVRSPLTGWGWWSLPVPTADVVIGHTLRADGRVASITLTGIEAIALSVTMPRRLRPFEAAARGLLERIVASFRQRIEDAVVGRTIELFRLPDALPGMGQGAALAFEPNGLGYVGRSVRAAIRIHVDP